MVSLSLSGRKQVDLRKRSVKENQERDASQEHDSRDPELDVGEDGADNIGIGDVIVLGLHRCLVLPGHARCASSPQANVRLK
jgi:hypothetical protein